jgi:hypothetical protein
MHRALVMLATLLLPAVAAAQTSTQTGLWFDGGGGLGLGGAPFAPAGSARAAIGMWTGNYDDRLALGRSWGFGAAARADLGDGTRRVAPHVEVRRQVDLLVVGLRWRVQAGPEWHDGAWGVGARMGGRVAYRIRPALAPHLDLEAGAAYVAGGVRPAMSVGIGLEGMVRLHDRARRDARREETP